MLRHLAKAYTLLLVSLVETGGPFVRMLLLSRPLSLFELGFVSALSTTINTFEMMAELLLHRFVFSAAREQYQDALAAAHGLAILRAIILGGLLALAAPLLARLFNLEDHVLDFVLLSPVVVLRGFDHLAPRVAERDYRYAPQLKATGASFALGLAALAIAVHIIPTHVAFLISLYAQVIVQVAMDHIVANERYRFEFFTPAFYRAFRFGYPLMLNGAALAAAGQGDRFIIGALQGLSELAVYSIATLATLTPSSLILRVTSSITLAQMYNAARHEDGRFNARMKLFARLVPLVAAFYALGVIALLNIVMPLVFGARFVLSPAATDLLALSIYLRLARAEPCASLLLNEGQTKRMAIANIASVSALPFELALLLIFHSLEAVMAGRLIGELIGTVFLIAVTRKLFRPAIFDFVKAVAVSVMVLGVAIALRSVGVGATLVPSVAMLTVGLAVFALWALSFMPALFGASFPRNAVQGLIR